MASIRRRDRNVWDWLRPVRRAIRRAEVAQVRRFGTSILATTFRTPVLVLETTGRRSGEPRATVLAHHRIGDGAILVAGGAGGQARIPDWVANVRADPAVTVTVDRVTVEMTARELDGDERRERWATAVRVWPQVETYERRAGRPIPLVVLEPR